MFIDMTVYFHSITKYRKYVAVIVRMGRICMPTRIVVDYFLSSADGFIRFSAFALNGNRIKQRRRFHQEARIGHDFDQPPPK